MGGWKSRQKVELSWIELEVWAKRAWRLKGRVQFQQLNQNIFFLDFELEEEAYWVMENGSRICRGEAMFLEWWSPSTGCNGRIEEEQEVWLRVVGLPLHMWTEEILKKVGNGCGGFVAMDKETEQRKDLRWARILVKKDRTRNLLQLMCSRGQKLRASNMVGDSTKGNRGLPARMQKQRVLGDYQWGRRRTNTRHWTRGRSKRKSSSPIPRVAV